MIICVSLLSFFASFLEVKADTGSDYGITIVKYKMDSTQITANNLPTQPSASDLSDGSAKSNTGEILNVFPGVEYKVEKVILKNGSGDNFEVESGSITQTIRTGSNGRASISLGEGIYRITEQSNAQLPTPAEPIIIQLPATLTNGIQVDLVYVYPKSSVVSSSPISPTSSTPTTYTSIPQTSGDLSSIFPLYLLLGGVVFIGVFSLIKARKRAQND